MAAATTATTVGPGGLIKTPIGYLQEVCSKRGVTPQYDLIATEGHVHEPTFVFRCQAGEFMATGKGPNKKTARHEAAQGVLQQMLSSGVQGITTEGIEKPAPIPAIPTLHDDGIIGNPVGQLQELTQKKKWSPPMYEFAQEQGAGHPREFVCVVRLGKKFKEAGGGKSKKAAKRKAAYQMLQRINQGANISREDMEPDDFDEDALSLAVDGKTSGYNKEGKKTSTFKLQGQLNMRMKAPSGKQLHLVKNLSFKSDDADYLSIVKSLGEEQKFETTFLEMPETEESPGCHMCLIQMTTSPATVCQGQGNTIEEAHNHAAKKALKYLKIMLKK